MKKIIATMLIMMLMVFCLSGCSKEQDEEIKTPSQDNVQSSETVLSLAELTEEQIDLFKLTAGGNVYDVLEGLITMDELESIQEEMLEIYVKMQALPNNGLELFDEWKESVDYYSKLAEWLMNNGLTAEVETIKPQVSEKDSDTREEHKADTVVQQTNKPKPSEKQEQTQKQEVTSKPIKPSNNTPKEEVVGTPGDVVSAGGGKSTVTDSENVVGGGFEASLAEDIAITEGISFEEALQRVKNGQY